MMDHSPNAHIIMKWVYYTLNLSLMLLFNPFIQFSVSQAHTALHPGLGLNGLLDDFGLEGTRVGAIRGRGRAELPLREVQGLVWGLLTRRLRGPALSLLAASHLLHLSLLDLGPCSISTSLALITFSLPLWTVSCHSVFS